MNKTIYRQYDSRWGSKPYPTKASTFSGNGCGCVACTHILIELEKYKNTTPETVRQYMVAQGFAVAHQGTTWSGIPKTLNHYGFKATEHNTLPELFKVLDKRKKNKQPCLGVILFGAGSRGGVTWTAGGHYVAFTDYKVENGKHYFYTKDSGPRCNDGWHAYETTMRGLIPKIWSAEAPAPAKKGSYTGSYPTATEILTSSNRGVRADIRNWSKKIADSGEYKYKRYDTDERAKECPICKNLKGKWKGWNCIGFVFACWHHGGKIPCKCNCHVISNEVGDKLLNLSDTEALKLCQSRIGIKDIQVLRNNNKSVPISKVMAGDILIYYKGNKYQHCALYVGNNRLADSTTGRKPEIMYGDTLYKDYQPKVVLHYTGGPSYIQKGNNGDAVKKIQKYLNWYGNYNLAEDAEFGQATLNAVKDFQAKEMGKAQADGLVGQKTIDAMKKVQK